MGVIYCDCNHCTINNNVRVKPMVHNLYFCIRVSFRIFIKGGGGKRDNSGVKGGGAKNIVCFSIREEGRYAH